MLLLHYVSIVLEACSKLLTRTSLLRDLTHDNPLNCRPPLSLTSCGKVWVQVIPCRRKTGSGIVCIMLTCASNCGTDILVTAIYINTCYCCEDSVHTHIAGIVAVTQSLTCTYNGSRCKQTLYLVDLHDLLYFFLAHRAAPCLVFDPCTARLTHGQMTTGHAQPVLASIHANHTNICKLNR